MKVTYKYIFEKFGFWVKIETDFGLVISNDIFNCMVYRNENGINCFILDYFQDAALADLIFLFNINPNKEGDDFKEEYKFDNAISKEDFLSFIFNLSPNQKSEYYQDALFGRIEEKNDALLLKSSNQLDKINKSRVVNFIAFDESKNLLQFNNTHCFFVGDNVEARKKCYLFWNPNTLIEYKRNLCSSEYTTFILPCNCDNRTLKIPIKASFEEYYLCYSCVEDQIEILRFVIQFLMIETDQLWTIHNSGNRIQIETQYFSREEVLGWAQFIADIKRNVRDACYQGEKGKFEFIYDENITIKETKYYYISMVRAPRLISIFIDKILRKYNLSNKIHISTI